MSEHSREIRSSLMDLPRLEQQFEMRAEKGYLVTRISSFWGSGNAVYEDITGEPYHFCVRPFEKHDFPEFKAGLESCGWTLGFTHGSLAVFHSRESLRPPVTAWGQDKLREMLLKKVCGEERNMLPAASLPAPSISLYAKPGIKTPDSTDGSLFQGC